MKGAILTDLIADKQFDQIAWESLTPSDLVAKDRFLNTFLHYAAHHWVWRRIPRHLINDENLRIKNPAGVCPLDRIVHNISDKEDLKDFQSLLPLLSPQSLEYLSNLGFKGAATSALREKRMRVQRVLKSKYSTLELSL